MDLSLFGWRTNEDQVKRAFAVTAAHFVTEDYNELTSSDLWHDGFRLHDRSAGTTLEVHSLVELELGRQYVTGHGNSIVRIDAATAVLANNVRLPVDLRDPTSPMNRGRAGSPATTLAGADDDSDEDQVQGALRMVRLLQAEPGPETLVELHRLLCRLHYTAAADGPDTWIGAFVALDGCTALLDVLSHSQLRATQAEAEERVQSQCVACLALLMQRRSALEAVLAQPHAITCIAAATSVRSPRAQLQVLQLLLRVALTPRGTGQLLGAWAALSDSEGGELRLASLVALLRRAPTPELQLGVLRLAAVMLDGPADDEERAAVVSEFRQLGLIDVARQARRSTAADAALDGERSVLLSRLQGLLEGRRSSSELERPSPRSASTSCDVSGGGGGGVGSGGGAGGGGALAGGAPASADRAFALGDTFKLRQQLLKALEGGSSSAFGAQVAGRAEGSGQHS